MSDGELRQTIIEKAIEVGFLRLVLEEFENKMTLSKSKVYNTKEIQQHAYLFNEIIGKVMSP